MACNGPSCNRSPMAPAPIPQMQPNQLPAPQYAPANRGFLGHLKDFFVGSPDTLQQLPRFNPQQQQLQALLGNQATSMLQNPTNNKFDFGPIAQKARTEFKTQTIPSIAARFSGMGNQRGSDYLGALGAAGASLDENLAALQSQYDFASGSQNQQLDQNRLLALLSMALQPQQENIFSPGQNGALQNILPFLMKLGLGFIG